MRLLRARRRSGVSSLEFALVVPVLFAMLIGLVDWGLAIDARIQLRSAVRAGAQYALRQPTDSAGIAAAVRVAASDLSLSVDDPVIWCECAGAAAGCTGGCQGGMQRFLSVTASRPYAPITPAGPTSIAANVTLRIR